MARHKVNAVAAGLIVLEKADAEGLFFKIDGFLCVGAEKGFLLLQRRKVQNRNHHRICIRQKILTHRTAFLEKAQPQRIVALNFQIERTLKQLEIDLVVNGKGDRDLDKLLMKAVFDHHVHRLLRRDQVIDAIRQLLLLQEDSSSFNSFSANAGKLI